MCAQLKDIKPIGLLRQRSSVDSKTSTTTTTPVTTTKFTGQTPANAAAVDGQFIPAPQRPSSSGEHGENGVDGGVQFTFTPGALAAMTRKTESPIDEDKQNV